MMKSKFLFWLKSKYNQEIDASGLAFFRLFYAAVLFFEVNQLFEYRHLIFDSIPYMQFSDINLNVTFLIWKYSIVFIFLGLFTRMASVINYIISIILIGDIGNFEYHVFYAYMGLNFILMFLPVSRVWSLDRLILKLRFSNAKFEYTPSKTASVMAYWVPLFVGVGLVYFDSIFFKFTDPIWMKGLGLWWPASHVCASYLALPELLNQKWLMLFLGYLTVLFELVFLFLFYFKRWRWIFWFIGIGLHVGILIFFPIPFFALAVVALYILLLPVGLYKKWNLARFEHRVTFYYDGECPLCARTKIVLEHFDVLGFICFKTVQSSYQLDTAISNIPMDKLLDDIHAVDSRGRIYKGFDTYKAVCRANVLLWPFYAFMLIPGVSFLGHKIYFLVSRNRITERCTDESCGLTFVQLPQKDDEVKLLKNLSLNDLKYSAVLVFVSFCIIVQLLMIYTANPVQSFFPSAIKNSAFNQSVKNCVGELHSVTKSFFGLTHHAVFGHYHFDEHDDLIKVVHVDALGNRELLPMTQEDGRPGEYISGCSWVQWTFRVLNSDVNHEKLIQGLKRYTAYWLKTKNRGSLNGHFEVFHKPMTVPDYWEKDALVTDLQNNNWKKVGEVDWINNVFEDNVQKID